MFSSPAYSGGFEVNENAANILARSGRLRPKRIIPWPFITTRLDYSTGKVIASRRLQHQLLSLEFERSGIDALVADGMRKCDGVQQPIPSLHHRLPGDMAAAIGRLGPQYTGQGRWKPFLDAAGPQRFLMTEENFFWATQASVVRMNYA